MRPGLQIPCYQVDAFTRTRFAGNPAAVCLLDRWLPDPLLQLIAAENALPETAFLVPQGDDYNLRWFTPEVEVDLCGHATLAAAFVLLTRVHPQRRDVQFISHAGLLRVSRDRDELTLDFPARPAVPADPPPGLLAALGCAQPREVLRARDWLVVLADAAAVRALQPDFPALLALPDVLAVCVTAPGDDGVDFVSRYFTPAQGIPEDPVTGSAHCTLTPYWVHRLGRNELQARQLSRRSGELRCTLAGERVFIAGHAVLTRTGHLLLDEL